MCFYSKWNKWIQSIVFNQRFASIRNVYLLGCGTNTPNFNFDFIDITNEGTYQISIGGKVYPQIALNAKIQTLGRNEYIKKKLLNLNPAWMLILRFLKVFWVRQEDFPKKPDPF